jgi:hypothetical protein
MKLKLKRDKVISVVKGKDLVGLYAIVKPKDFAIYLSENIKGIQVCEKGNYEVLLGEMSPAKADKIISLWNK